MNGTVLRLTLKLSNQEGGATGTIVSVDQRGSEIPISSITQASSHLKIMLGVIGATYEGDLKEGQIASTWTQGPGSWPLVFKRQQK